MDFSTTSLIKTLNDKFNDFSFDFKEYKYGGQIQSFFVTLENREEYLKREWQNISNLIAVNFQTTLDAEFSIWNIYIFFIVENPISGLLKYEIENDTFSSRKIIVNSGTPYDVIVNQHIINNDLDLNPETNLDLMEFVPDTIIWQQLEGKEANKRLTVDDRKIFNNIVELLKRLDNEVKKS